MQLRSWISPNVVVGIILTMVGLVSCAGCGGSGYAGPSGAVTGTVKLAGQPVPDGSTVTFISDAGHTANGTVSGGGSYKLVTIDKDGSKQEQIPAGKYRVTVGPPTDSKVLSDAEYDKKMQESGNTGDTAAPPPPSAIPVQYQSTTTSQLTFEVKEGPNTIDIELK